MGVQKGASVEIELTYDIFNNLDGNKWEGGFSADWQGSMLNSTFNSLVEKNHNLTNQKININYQGIKKESMSIN